MTEDIDSVVLGKRIRHARQSAGFTLQTLGTHLQVTPSYLSQIETGKRTPRINLLNRIAAACDTDINYLLKNEAPNPRAKLELALEAAQTSSEYVALHLPHLRPSPSLPLEYLTTLVGLHKELRRLSQTKKSTPEAARRANSLLRQEMRDHQNYFPDIEALAGDLADAVGHDKPTPLGDRGMLAAAEHLGFTLHYAPDLPRATRSITDLRHHRIYLAAPPNIPHQEPAPPDRRRIIAGALGHYCLRHTQPASFAEFLRQRIEVNYFAAALLMPQRTAARFLQTAKSHRDLSIDDLRAAYGVSHETAAHRFTNLATAHLDLTVHFTRVGEDGLIYKAYENDNLIFPTDLAGSIEGQMACRAWGGRRAFGQSDRYRPYFQYLDTPTGTYWSATQIIRTENGDYAIDVGVPYVDVKYFRGRETRLRASSTCPDSKCCRRPIPKLANKWDNYAWPSARTHSHVLAAMPPGIFPGVDDVSVYEFLERHEIPSGQAAVTNIGNTITSGAVAPGRQI